MGYVAIKVFIIYWNPDKTFGIHISHHVWINEYISHISIEYKNTPSSLLLQK